MKKGFIKTIALFLVALVVVVTGIIFYLNHQKDVDKTKDGMKSIIQDKKEDLVDKVIEEGKNSLGEMLKEAGENMINNNSESNDSSTDNQYVGENSE